MKSGHFHVAFAVGALVAVHQVADSSATWTKSSPVNPLPKNSVMISNATLNPVPVYECAVHDPDVKSNYIVGALAYEQKAWRCMYYDPSSATNLSSVGPGNYEVCLCVLRKGVF